MASTRSIHSSLGVSNDPVKLAPSNDMKNKSQAQTRNTRKPLQTIDSNLVATRVQPSRQAKRKQQKAFGVFVDAENKRGQDGSQKTEGSKGDRMQIQHRKNTDQTTIVTTLSAASSLLTGTAYAALTTLSATHNASSASTLVINSDAASFSSSDSSAARFSFVPVVDAVDAFCLSAKTSSNGHSSSCPDDIIDLLSSPVSMDMSQLEKSLPLSDRDDSEVKIIEELYAMDIYHYLLAREKTNVANPRYMTKQTDINHRMRTILIDWLIEVSEELQLSPETLYITVNLIDRFLSKMNVSRSKLQLVGTAALLVAAKYEEIYPPGAKDLIYLTDDCYTVQQLFRMEDLLLKVVNYDVSLPNPESFLVQINKFADSDEQTTTLSKYIVEISSMHGEFYLCHTPSLLSASAVCVARHTLGYLPWSDELTNLTSYGEEDLRDCSRQLCDILGAVNQLPKATVREKYSQVKYHEVAYFNPPSTYPL